MDGSGRGGQERAQRDEGTRAGENLCVGEEALSDLTNWAPVLLCPPFL